MPEYTLPQIMAMAGMPEYRGSFISCTPVGQCATISYLRESGDEGAFPIAVNEPREEVEATLEAAGWTVKEVEPQWFAWSVP